MHAWPGPVRLPPSNAPVPPFGPQGTESMARRMRILLPASKFRSFWESWILSLVLYNAIGVPFEFGFGYRAPLWLFIFDVVVDVAFLADIAINFRTAYFDRSGKLEMDGRKIAHNYLRTWFFIDLIASVPVDWFMTRMRATAEGDRFTSDVGALGAAKIPRLLRLGRLLKKIDRLDARAVRVFHLLAFLLVLAHWVACIFWKVGVESGPAAWPYREDVIMVLTADSSEQLQNRAFEAAGNASALLEVYSDLTYFKRYLTSFYWALTMVMKSPWKSPSTMAEQFYSCFTLILGSLSFAAFIGMMTALITSVDRNNALYRDQVSALTQFGQDRGLKTSSLRLLLSYWVRGGP